MLKSPLLLVCLAIGCGALLGSVSIRKISLGVAGVLFAGILWGYVAPGVSPPDVLATFGLALFVYAIGLSSSDLLFDIWSHGGWRFLLIPPVAVGIAFAVLLLASRMLDMPSSTASGIFAGALTNTPSLAAATTVLGKRGAEATLAYATTYPLGVLIPILMLAWPFRHETPLSGDKLASAAIAVGTVREPGEAIDGLLERHSLTVRFGRCVREGEHFALSGYSVIKNGDIVTVVGLADDVRRAVEALGSEHRGDLRSDRSQLDYRRIFASSPAVCGKTLDEIGIFRNFEGIVTRIRRGDRDFIPTARTTILPGDRLRVVAPRERLSEITEYVGDSYQEASEFNILTFGLGLAMGIGLGTVDISLPMGLGMFEIGPVAGCLIVGLILGALGRTGPLTWHMPYGTSISLRQLGLVLFLACSGIKAGSQLHTAPVDLSTLLVGAGITTVACLATVAMGLAIAGTSWPFIGGILAGIQTQTAVLGFAVEHCGNERVEAGYAEAYTLSMLLKILLVQILLLVMKS
ncbi:aspartate:alanine exchanger family transporter [Geobacter sp. SVR]|uniref:aspartate:alanine exchanger family transporter n=1 Tax=Geobacter sp. SVR TaxID=2495594 RepID=UPI00143EFCDF|nr:TrkA C-terminal domain-containing protein [Geobacter sp. SVR]BCS54437.1 putative transporter [Geobacter sp. SVR]GCF87669.1 putative transporter [Geobacter sp. SVR]